MAPPPDYTHSAETRAKISAGNKGRVFTDTHRAALSEGITRRWSDPEQRRMQSERRKGKPLSEAHKQAMRDAWAAKRAAKEKQS